MTSDRSTDTDNSRRWRTVYVAVAAYTALIILLLGAFGRYFTG